MYTSLTTEGFKQAQSLGFKPEFDYLPGFLVRETEEINLFAIGNVWLYGIKKDGTFVRSFRLLKKYIKDLIEKGLIVEGD